MKSLIFADAHAQVSAWSGRSITGDAEFALSQIAELAVAHRVASVEGLGDLIDQQRNRSAPPKMLERFAAKLHDAEIPFGFLQGQHEADTPPWLSSVPGAHHRNGQLFELGGIKLFGLDFHPQDRLQEALVAIPPDADVLLAHQCWSEWMGDVTNPQGEFAQVPHVGCVISGDKHQYILEQRQGADGQAMLVCSPGATCMQAINEPSVHYVLLLSDDGSIKKIKLKSRVFVDWDVMTTKEDLTRFGEQFESELTAAMQRAATLDLPEALMTPLLRVTYSHKLDDAMRRVARIVGSRAHLFWKEIPPDRAEAEKRVIKTKVGEAVTPLSVLPLEVDKDSDAFALTSRLLGTRDIDAAKAELAKYRSEFLA